jgi:hypothetical protein
MHVITALEQGKPRNQATNSGAGNSNFSLVQL